MHQNHLGGSLRHRLSEPHPQSVRLGRTEVELRICLSNSVPGDTQVLVWGSTENPAGEVLWSGKAGREVGSGS